MFKPTGTWCDVCALPDGRIAFVYVDGPHVVCEINGVKAWSVATPAPQLFIRCEALSDNTVAAIGKANDPQGTATLILRGTVMPLGPTAGNNPVALTATHAYIVTGSDKAHRISLADGSQEPVTIRWTGQGLRDVLPNGTVILGDDTLGAQIKGYNFGEYQTRGDLTVGQHGNGVGVLVADHFFVARNGPENFSVHGAQNKSLVAVCAFTELGSYFQTFTPPYPVAPPVVAPPPPVVVAPPPPPVIPTPPKMSTPNRLDIVKQVGAQHPELMRLNTKDACGRLTEFIALALNAADPGWGLLSKSAGENNYRGHAVDAIIYNPTQQVIDMMSGGGDRDLLTPSSTEEQRKAFDHDIRLKWDEVGKRANNNWMAPIQPEGEVVVVPPPVVVPPVVVAPPPAIDPSILSAIFAVVSELKSAINDLKAQQVELTKHVEDLKPVTDLYGTVALPFVGTGRVDLTTGKRPVK
jgi:hypothetical protein